MALLGPFNVAYPVLFRSGGDTTRVAFGKHIQEIERIYGILNALDADKLSASDLDGKLGSFKPKMSFSDISGSLDMSRVTGNLDASRVIGKLTNANIDAGNVNGLNSFVQGLIPPQKDNGDGITVVEPNENGYARFANGLLIQWGVVDYAEGINQKATFPIPFPHVCLNIIITASTEGVKTSDGDYRHGNFLADPKILDKKTTNSEFFFGWNFKWEVSSGHPKDENPKMRYLAIGY